MIILEKCQPEKWPITLLVQAILDKFYIFSFYEIPLISNSSLSIFFKVVLFFKEILYFYFLILISTLVWKTLTCMIWHQFPSWRNIASHRVFHTNFQLRKKIIIDGVNYIVYFADLTKYLYISFSRRKKLFPKCANFFLLEYILFDFRNGSWMLSYYNSIQNWYIAKFFVWKLEFIFCIQKCL